jgi:probable HAF family extracellular repeat protein
MRRLGLSSVFSHALGFKLHDAHDLRARSPKRRSRASSRPAVDFLERRELLSSYTIEDLGSIGGKDSHAYAINASGQVVGASQLADGTSHSHAVLWDPGKPGKDLGTLGGLDSTAFAINGLGEIIGFDYTSGVGGAVPSSSCPAGR